MRRLLFAVSLLLSSAARADDFYVPLGGTVDGHSSTIELRIVNPSDRSTTVSMQLLGLGSKAETVKQFTLAARESVTELFVNRQQDALTIGALRISTDGAMRVTALNRCSSCATSSSIPVIDRGHLIDEGAIPGGVSPNDDGWQSSVAVMNPDSAPAVVTLSLQRGEEVLEQASLRIAARGMRLIRVERLFSSAREPGDVLTFSASPRLVLFGVDINTRSGARVFTPPISEAGFRRRRAVRFTTFLAPAPQTVVLTASKDNTLYETSNGALSNGAGVHLFAGATASKAIRRALLAFDVASQIPPGSRVTRAMLTLQLSLTIAAPQPMELHRVTADWGQGTSNAGSSRDGSGAASRPDDATWIHTFFPDRFWSTPGGDFSVAIDATTLVGASGAFTWDSSTTMIARVQEWLDQPATNFGWLLLGNEATGTTAKRFDSREASPSTRPALTVEFVR